MYPDDYTFQARQFALSQACHDDKGKQPIEDTLKRAQEYAEFLLGHSKHLEQHPAG